LHITYEQLYRSYLDCRKGKRNTFNALKYEARQELLLLDLLDALQSQSYQPASSVCFVTKKPKLREIFAADFQDRIVHHLVVRELEKIWEPKFIYDSYACRKGKGVHKGVNRLQGFIRKASKNGTRPAWYLQLDIKNYFMRIDKSILWSLLAPKITDSTLLWLTHMLVFHDCTQGYIFKGKAHEQSALPAHKTLIKCEPGKGLPIGNLNSQFFANVYLNPLDQFVKHELKYHHYLRYCDDFILLGHSKEQLLASRAQIAAFLSDTLALSLNPKSEKLGLTTNGVNFLGYIVREKYLLVRKRVIGNLKEKLAYYRKALVTEEDGIDYYHFDDEILDKLYSSLQSYFGHFKQASSFNLRCAIWSKNPFLYCYFTYDAEKQRLNKRYCLPASIKRVRSQYLFFKNMYPECVVLFQVGSYIEFYSKKDTDIAKLLHLHPLKPNKRQAVYGFPVGQWEQKLIRLMNAGKPVLFVKQEASKAFGNILYRKPGLIIKNHRL